jgi:hypothetical protein
LFDFAADATADGRRGAVAGTALGLERLLPAGQRRSR